VRIDAQLYYANVLTVRDQIKAMIAEMEPPPRAVVFDMGSQDTIDVTTQEFTRSMVKELHRSGLTIYLADVHAPLRESASRTGLLEAIGKDHVFPSVDSAVRFIEMTTPNQLS
jgi:MFS superfamily sulfate permease-like transporter